MTPRYGKKLASGWSASGLFTDSRRMEPDSWQERASDSTPLVTPRLVVVNGYLHSVSNGNLAKIMSLLSRRVRNNRMHRQSSRRHRRSRLERLEPRQLLAADITGAIYNDLNGDGVRNQGENGLSSWTVFLDLNRDGTPAADEPTQLTDADGKFTFAGVAAGDYRVAEVVRSGWTATNPTTAFVEVTAIDGEDAKVEFLNHGSGGTGVITGHVWRDLNNNGIQEAGESGVAGWQIYLDLDTDRVLDPDEPFEITDGDGNYTFTNILGGGAGDAIDYEVVEVLTAGWEAAPGFSDNYTVGVIEGQTTIVPDFANTPVEISRVEGNVWNDINGNGVRDAGEPGLGGWTIYADLNTNNALDAGEPSTTTSLSGNYSLIGLEPGTHRIAEIPDITFKPTSPLSGYQTVIAPNQGTRSNVNFGNQQRTDAAIGGIVFVDRDQDGIRDPGEEGLSGITVYLDDNNNGELDAGERSVETSRDLFYTPDVDEAGAYRFENLAAGIYTIRQVVPSELSSTPTGEREHTVVLGPTDDRSDIDSADRYRPSEIHGIKFDDLNGDGSHDSGEPGLPGVTIFIDLNRNNMLDAGEPTTITGSDGSYSFTGLDAGAYIVREIVPDGWVQTFPETRDGTLWPEGVSNPAIGNVTPTLIQASLATGQTYTQTVSLTLPTTGALTNMVDVFLLFDDTGSFRFNSPIVRAAFPNIITALETRLPGIDLGFGVGRLEEYGHFASEYSTGRPFVLNQPIISSSAAGYTDAEVLASIQAALDREAPGYGGDQPETVIEALYQMVTGAGFDGNDNGSLLDSGTAGLASTQLTPGDSGDVPPFASFTADPSNGVLAPSGTIGGAGFRSGALPIIITATDTGFAYQPKGESTITGVDGLSLPASAITYNGRGTTPFSSGAGIQETVTGLNALGALVIGLGVNDSAAQDPRVGLEALANLTGAINRTAETIANGTADEIAPGDPFYFKIGSGGDPLVLNIADGIVAAIEGAVTAVNVNVTLRASDPRVLLDFAPGVINGLGAGDTATFDVTFTGDGRPHRFDLQFVREGTDVVLGSIPVVLGTPVIGDGYEYEDCDDGVICLETNFGNRRSEGFVPNVAPSFTAGADQTVLEDAGTQTVASWATDISVGPASESGQVVDFLVSNDNSGLFAVQPAISADGTLTYTLAENAFGAASVTVRAHDNGGTAGGGLDTSAAQVFVITVTPVNDVPSFTAGLDQTVTQDSGAQSVAAWASDLSAGPANESTQLLDFLVSNDNAALFSSGPSITSDGTLTYTPAAGASGSATVTVQIHDDGGTTDGGVDTSVPQTFTITVTATPDSVDAKFFVVDGTRKRVFEYGADGNPISQDPLHQEDKKPRGIAANQDGSVLWVVDERGDVFVYNSSDYQLLGFWQTEGVGKPEGITVYGDDLWVVDRERDRVYFFENGALLREGNVLPSSSFSLQNGNSNPKGLTTDGEHVWVVNDARRTDRVFRYTIDGIAEGSWQIDARNSRPTGITIDPSDVNHLWIVDARSDAVYQYDSATGRLAGAQDADQYFRLAGGNRNPQGIADPPVHSSGRIGNRDDAPEVWDRAIPSWDRLPSRMDANEDGRVSFSDALAVINHLERGRNKGTDDLLPDVSSMDVTTDGKVSARDALVIINQISRDLLRSESIDLAIGQLTDDDDAHWPDDELDVELVVSRS